MSLNAMNLPKEEEAQMKDLDRLLKLGPPALIGHDPKDKIQLPLTIYLLLKEVVSAMNQGKIFSLVPDDEQLTTQAAANILGMSRPHLVNLLNSGEIPYRKTGSHRRLLLSDVQTYQHKRDARRRAILRDLSKEAYAEGLYTNAGMPEGGEDE